MRLLLFVLLSSAPFSCRAPGPAALAVGGAADGTLTADDVDAYHGVTADALPVRVEGGGPVAIVVTSETMDAFAIVAARGAPVGAASGVAGGHGACVTVQAPHALDLLLYVSSAGAAPYGDYHVEVVPATPEVAAAHDCQAAPAPGGAGAEDDEEILV